MYVNNKEVYIKRQQYIYNDDNVDEEACVVCVRERELKRGDNKCMMDDDAK